MKHDKIAIIGGGASGLTAAIIAARNGAFVTVLERNDRVGKKIPATGNGRCNLTNMRCSTANYHGRDPSFVKKSLDLVPPAKVREFFRSLGVITIEEDQGRVYPLTGQASAILDALRFETSRLHVETITGVGVTSVLPAPEKFTIKSNKGTFTYDKLLIAAGGCALPSLGGTDSGLRIMQQLGHSLLEPYPALVPLKTDFRYGRQLKGVKVQADAVLEIEGKTVSKESGEFLFTEYGLSGIPILQFSLRAGNAISGKERVKILFDLFPMFTEAQLSSEIQSRLTSRPDEPAEQLFTGLIHKKLIPVACRENGLDNMRTPAKEFPISFTARCARFLKNWEFTVNGTLSFNDAQVMGGGITTSEFDSSTMESRIVKNLYACGELLDITGDCGGYNLQWAWSSGYIAGSRAST